MKLTKKMIICMAFGTMLLTLQGCAKGTSSQAGSADKKETVEILNDKGEGTGPAKTIIPIMEKNTGFKIKYVNTPDLSAYQTNIQQSLQGGNAPTLFTWWVGSQLKEFVENDLIEDLSDQWDSYVKEGVSDQIKDALSVDGKVYGAPLNVLYNGVFYNKDIFEKYNVQTPTTFDEFIEVCAKLKENGVTPIGIGNTWQSFVWPQALMGSMDPELYEEWTSGKVPFTDQRVKSIFYQWVEMLKEGYFSNVQQDQVKDFAGKKVGMMYQATNLLTSLNNEYGLVSGKDMDVFLMPSVKGKKKTIFYEVAPLVIGKNSSNKEEGKKVLKAYYTKAVQQEYADKTGMSAITNVSFSDPISKLFTENAADPSKTTLQLRYYEQFTPAVVNLSIDEYWKIAANPTKEQVDKSLATIQKAWEKEQKQ